MLLKDAITEYCFDCRIRKLSPGTIDNYMKQPKVKIITFSVVFLGNANVRQKEISTAAISEFYRKSSLSAAMKKAAMYLKVFPSSHNCLN